MARDTRDLHRVLPISPGCITAHELRMLAIMMDKLALFHKELAGTEPDRPCLRELGIQDGKPFARVDSGARTFRLDYAHGSWSFG